MKIFYAWVLRKTPGRWLVSDWDGNERWIDIGHYDVAQDMERDANHSEPAPVIRWIGSGHIAQHFRFELVHAESEAAE